MYIDTQTEPIREDAPIGGRSVYGATKAAAEMAAFAIGEQLGVDIVAARPFNHIGPGQSGAFVVPNFARQVASIAAGAVPAVIRAGSLAPERDFTDVRDVVRAYRMLVEGGEPQTAYNVASGRAVSIKQLLDQLVEIADIKVHVQTDPSLVRTDEPDRMVGDASRLNARTGWQPTIDLRKSLHDVYVEAKRAQSSSPGIDM
jgi:GDP-4-dehydro-6-deoxy-D-mannose reductase